MRRNIAICGCNVNVVKDHFTKRFYVRVVTVQSSIEESRQRSKLRKHRIPSLGLLTGEQSIETHKKGRVEDCLNNSQI